MSDSKILVVPASLLNKIDENRGDLSRADFIGAVIDNLVGDKSETKKAEPVKYATSAELASFESDMKQLLKSFLDFFMSYGMEMGDNGSQVDFEKLTNKLQGLQKDLGADSSKGLRGTIKWK